MSSRALAFVVVLAVFAITAGVASPLSPATVADQRPATAAGDAGHPGFPILACDDPRYPYANHYGRNFRPSGLCRTKRGNGAEGIDHTRWHGWGGRRSTGRGFLVVYNGGVEEYPATITAQGLWSTNHFIGTNNYFSAYTALRVHVLARRASTAGAIAWSGPLDLTLSVPVQE
jgi:hypothetical protein